MLGKTHTMHGFGDEEGIIGMAVDQLFNAVKDSPGRQFSMPKSIYHVKYVVCMILQ